MRKKSIKERVTCQFKDRCRIYDKASVICNSWDSIDRNSFCGKKREFEKHEV